MKKSVLVLVVLLAIAAPAMAIQLPFGATIQEGVRVVNATPHDVVVNIAGKEEALKPGENKKMSGLPFESHQVTAVVAVCTGGEGASMKECPGAEFPNGMTIRLRKKVGVSARIRKDRDGDRRVDVGVDAGGLSRHREPTVFVRAKTNRKGEVSYYLSRR